MRETGMYISPVVSSKKIPTRCSCRASLLQCNILHGKILFKDKRQEDKIVLLAETFLIEAYHNKDTRRHFESIDPNDHEG